MKTTINKPENFFLAIITTFLVFFLSACSSGSSSPASDPLASLPYNGLTSAAEINTTDINNQMLSTYLGYSPLYSLMEIQNVSAQSSTALAQVLLDEQGQCGGIANYNLDVNEQTGSFQGSVFFNAFNDCEITTTGTIEISGQVDLQSGEITKMTSLFELLSFTDSNSSDFVASGKIILSRSDQNETMNINMRVRDENTSKVYWLDNYQTTVLYGYDSRSYEETTISGRYYDPDRGYFALSTKTPIRTYVDDAWPSSGVFVVEGAVNSSARLTFVSAVLYQVEVDINGDGTYEYDAGIEHFPGANTLPVVEIDSDTVANVNCSMSLDGSRSSDADLDTLQYMWKVLSAPAGSLSQLSSTSSAVVSFTPDMKGVYRFSLSVYDGYDTVTKMVDITTYGDLFCLNDTTISSYGLFGQYEAGVTVGDVTGDGKNDILALTQEAELYLFKQNGSGALDSPVMYTVDNWRAVAVGDVTGDGKNDAVVTTNFGVGMLAQDDSGELTAMVEYLFTPALSYSAYTYSLALGDFNNDSRLDVAVLPEGQPLYIFLQNADGTLGASSIYDTAPNSGWSKVIAGDVTGDGLTDIVLSRADSYATDNIGVLAQNASGTFDAPVYYSIGNLPYTYTYPVALGDLNGDGRLDLAYDIFDDIDANSTFIGVLAQSANGVFSTSEIYSAYYPPIKDMVIADVTGDGRNDLVALHGTPNSGLPFSPTTVSVYAGTETGTLASYDNYPLAATPQSWGEIDVGDVDGDGKNDVIVTAHGCDGYNNCGPYLVVLHGVK